MSDEINWDIDSLRAMVVELNRKGIEVKNKVANIFWQFRYQVTPYWEGENYNKVMEFVNQFVHSDGNGGYGTGFKEKTDMVAYDIPKKIEDFVNVQAQAGGGQAYNQNLISAYDSGNSDVWEVPLSVISKDGARRISVEKVQQFFIGTTDPSVKGEVELAKTKLNEYLAIFDAYEPYTKGNAAAVTARADVEEFINMFIARTDYMLGVVIDVANAEISGIEEVDIESIKLAHQGTAQPQENPNPDNPESGSENNGDGSKYNWTDDPCHLNSKGSNVPDGYDWVDDPCHYRSSGNGSNSGNNSEKSSDGSGYNWTDDPCHLKPSGVNAPDGYDWNNDPCHFINTSSTYSNPPSTPKASNGYTYDASQDWSEMSDKDKVARGYVEYVAAGREGEYKGDAYLNSNPNLTDAQKDQIRELSGKRYADYDHSGYDKPDYDRTADWSELSSDQRVAKAYDDHDFVSKLSDSEQVKYSEAQYKAGDHVDYNVPESGGIYRVNPKSLNDRQRVQWAIDMREEVIDDNYNHIGKDTSGLNAEAYWRKTAEGLTAEQLAEVDVEVNQYEKHFGDQDIGATYADPYSTVE